MIFKLRGKIQHYDWGGAIFIPHFIKLDEHETLAKPYAEYWLGAHKSAPAEIEVEGKWVTLDKVIQSAPELLGEGSRSQFGDELPFLLKILDVKQPLSIQIHPTKAEAEYGFAQEEQNGVALNAAHRVYKDRNHKPEMMIALSNDFWLLHGFKSISDIQTSLEAHDSLKPLATYLHDRDLPSLYAYIMQAEKEQLAQWIKPIIYNRLPSYQADKLSPDEADYWVCYLFEEMGSNLDNIDGGWVSFYLFNIVHLKKGEGIYQGANLPHAYLRGQNVELMANSDNVIRGGLTPKHIDIPALLHSIDYRAITPNIIPAYEASEEFIHLYNTPEAKDFALQSFEFKPFDEETFTATSASILLVMKGSLYIDLGDDDIHLDQGESVFIGAGSKVDIIGETDGYAVVATLPDNHF